jgi:hypothetical protein
MLLLSTLITKKTPNVKDEQPIMICKGYEEGGSVVISTWMSKFS